MSSSPLVEPHNVSFWTLFDAVPDALLVCTLQGQFELVNQSASHLWGRPREDFLTLRWSDVFDGPLPNPLQAATGISAMNALRAKAGPLAVSVHWRRMDDQGQTKLVSSVRDLTSLHRAESALVRSSERLALAADAGQVGIWDFDVRSGALIWDAWMHKIFGIEPEQFSGTYEAWANAVHPQDLPATVAALEVTLRGEAPFLARFRIIRPDGTLRWIKAIGGAIRNPQGEVVRVIGTNIDITEEVQTQEQLTDSLAKESESNRALAMSNQELDAFSYSVSHDLRSPLRSMDGFSKILLTNYADKLDDAGRELLERIRGATKRMGSLIDDMLVLSRISRAELSPVPFDISALAQEVAQNLREAEPARDVSVHIQPGIQATGDARLVRIVLENLLGNAWKFTSKTEAARIEFGCELTQGRLEYFVRDNGAGFDMAYVDRLFGAFQRLHSAADFQGSGIGLATVARVINKHGGQFRAHGEIDHGATFWFSLQP